MKVLLVGLTIVAGAIGAGVGYAGIKTASLPSDAQSAVVESVQSDSGGQFPEGYVSGSATYSEDFNRSESAKSSRMYESDTYASEQPRSTQSAEYGEAGESSVTVSSSELNDMVMDAIASRPYTAPILDTAKDITTAIKKDRIESGARINLSDLPLEALPAEGRQAVEQLTQTFPFLANRDVYVGVEGSPRIVNGDLSLDDTYIRFGQLRLPVGSVANQLGLSRGEIEQQIGALLDQQGMSLSDVRIEDGQLVIVGQ